jgi:hypothetical protein
MVISLCISNVAVSAAMTVNPQVLQEIESHLTEVQTALANKYIEGAKRHLDIAMELLSQLTNKTADLESSPGMADNTTNIR